MTNEKPEGTAPMTDERRAEIARLVAAPSLLAELKAARARIEALEQDAERLRVALEWWQGERQGSRWMMLRAHGEPLNGPERIPGESFDAFLVRSYDASHPSSPTPAEREG